MKKTLVHSSLLAVVLLLALFTVGPALASQEGSHEEPILKVDINRADAQELMKLPGIGEKVAERILAHREEHGPFGKTEELMNVRGIGEKTYRKLEPHLTVGGGNESGKK